MQAPLPKSVALHVEPVRCSCHVETLIVSAAPWYAHQESRGIEPACVGCGRSLLEQQVAMGSEVRTYREDEAPPELTEPGAHGSGARWCLPHEAPEAYVASLEKPLALPALPVAQWAVATALVAIYVAVCIAA